MRDCVTETITVKGLDGFIRSILELRDHWAGDDLSGADIWFRGVKRSSFQLIPGAYWRSQCDEESLFVSFKAAAPSYVPTRPGNDWEWYFLGQHYGLPTRLLDWTESPLTALYFALTEKDGDCAVPQADDPPTVWMMDPAQLNQATHRLSEGYLFIPDVTKLRSWLPSECGRDKPPKSFTDDSDFRDNSKPVAIYPVRYNSRLVAQRGVFTVHGTEELPIDHVFRRSNTDGSSRIAKITIDPASCQQLLRDLVAVGVNQTAMFPEPGSVASDLVRHYAAR
jgi:hypothetical protein